MECCCLQILKEAKEESNKKAAAAERPSEETGPTVDLFNEFDKFQGLAHLEALEMLSRDCEAKVSGVCTKNLRTPLGSFRRNNYNVVGCRGHQ